MVLTDLGPRFRPRQGARQASSPLNGKPDGTDLCLSRRQNTRPSLARERKLRGSAIGFETSSAAVPADANGLVSGEHERSLIFTFDLIPLIE